MGVPQGASARRLLFGDGRRVGVMSSDVYRLASYCDERRQEMHLFKQRELCSEVLNYNLSEPSVFSRSHIPNCNLVLGSGNATECRDAMRSFLMPHEFPFCKEAVNLGFSSVESFAARQNTPVTDVVVLGPFAPSIARGVTLYSPAVAVHHNKKQSAETHTFQLSNMEGAVQRACEAPNLLVPGGRSDFGRMHSCLYRKQTHCVLACLLVSLSSLHFNYYDDCVAVSYAVELLYAVGARGNMNVTFETGNRTFPGFFYLGNENHPTILHNTYSERQDHWKF